MGNCPWIVASAFVLLTSALPAQAKKDDNTAVAQPDWTLILSIFIISSAIAAVFGIVSLTVKPKLQVPVFSRPAILESDSNVDMSVMPETDEPVMTTYRQYPMDYGQESYQLNQIRPQYTTESYQRHQQQQPIMVTTQRM